MLLDSSFLDSTALDGTASNKLVELLDTAVASASLSSSRDSTSLNTANAIDKVPFAMTLNSIQTASITDVIEATSFAFYLESVVARDTLAGSAITSLLHGDSIAALDIAQIAINQIVADSAAGTDGFSINAAVALVDIANAVSTESTTHRAVMLVAEIIAALDVFNSAPSNNVVESIAASDAMTARILGIASIIESAMAADSQTGLLRVYRLSADTAGAVDITTGSGVITALLNDSAIAIVRLSIGGELFTGWVMNADTLAPSEYQFANLAFNSACQHGKKYLMAADDGIYQFTEDVGVETVMTYIKTGKMDFGSDKHKRVINAYMAYSATGQMMLRVTTSENGAIKTHSYQMAPFASYETTDTRRVDIGKGIKSRYWQFEVVGDGVNCEFDEIGVLPVILSRRI